MAFKKDFTSNQFLTFNYVRIGRCNHKDERTKSISYEMELLPSADAHAKGALPSSFGHVTFKGAGFDRYFTRAAIMAAAKAGKSEYDVVYQAIKDLLAANRALLDHDNYLAAVKRGTWSAGATPPPAPTADQLTLLHGPSWMANDYHHAPGADKSQMMNRLGGSLALEGALDA